MFLPVAFRMNPSWGDIHGSLEKTWSDLTTKETSVMRCRGNFNNILEADNIFIAHVIANLLPDHFQPTSHFRNARTPARRQTIHIYLPFSATPYYIIPTPGSYLYTCPDPTPLHNVSVPKCIVECLKSVYRVPGVKYSCSGTPLLDGTAKQNTGILRGGLLNVPTNTCIYKPTMFLPATYL